MNKYFQTLVFALAAMFTFSVSADDVSDLKGMMEDLQERNLRIDLHISPNTVRQHQAILIKSAGPPLGGATRLRGCAACL